MMTRYSGTTRADDPDSRPGPRGLFGLLVLLGTLVCLPAAAQEPDDEEPRVLVVVLDAVPYHVAAAVARKKPEALAGFQPPAEMISSFPSDTVLALTGLFGAAGMGRSPGYEVRFYDRLGGTLRGGDLVSYHTLGYPHHRFFDWRMRGILNKGLAYGFPRAYNRKEPRAAVRAFLRSDKRVFFAYVSSTDASGHSIGYDQQERALGRLVDVIAQARQSAPPFHVVLLSDHGMSGPGKPLVNLERPVKQALRDDGWRRVRRLRTQSDVVHTAQSLVGCVVLYAQPGREEALAATVSDVPGVDFCVYPAGGDAWVVRSGATSARIERRGEPLEWSYQAGPTDPLGYQDVWDGATWLADGTVWERTHATEYPDAPHRIAAAFEMVDYPASVICSTEPDAMHGSRGAALVHTILFGRIARTHGSLRRAHSAGFVLTDHPAFSGADSLRYDEALDFLGGAASR